MPRYTVTVVIENKQGLSDPEGQTILKDLILKKGGTGSNDTGNNDNAGDDYNDNNDTAAASHTPCISEIRAAKMLRMIVDSNDAESALQYVKKTCDDLHLYNPIVSSVQITVAEQD